MKAKFSFRPLFPSKSKKTGSICGTNTSYFSLSSSSFSSFDDRETPKSVLPDLDVFKLLDRDGDGKISLQELELVFHRLGVDPPTDEELLLLLQEADQDGDGCISEGEFEALNAAMGPVQAEELREAFDYYDRDGDGRISAEELQRVFAAIGERCTLEECRSMIGRVNEEEKAFVCFEDFARMMMIESHMLGVDMEGTSGVGERSSRMNLKWNLNQDNYFISLMVAQHQMGHFMNGGFTSEGWNLISNDMIKTYGNEFTKDKLKHRLKSLKKNYGIVKKIIEQSGFGWDDVEKKVNADDMVWEDYIKSHPEAKIYRSKKLPDYMGLAELFGDALSDEREAMSAFNPVEENVHLDSTIEKQMDYEIDESVHANINTTNASNHRSAMSSGKSSHPAKGMRPTMGNSLINSLNAMTSIFIDLASKALQPQPPYEPPSQLARCVVALKELELPKKTYFKAFNFLRDSDRQAEAFLAHDKDDRREWLSLELDDTDGVTA